MYFRHWVTLSLTGLLVLAESTAAACPTSGVQIPSGPLSRALISLGRQCRISLVVQADNAATLVTPSLNIETPHGSIAPALHQLLDNTPLTFTHTGTNAIAIIAKPQESDRVTTATHPLPAEEVTVTGRSLTGTHLRHLKLDSYAPIDVLAQPELEITGAQTVAELLKFLPAVSGNSTSTSVTNGGNGTATVTLRGLPASNTLVLINGRRIVSNGFGGEAADLNTIPLSAVDRIEVLKDGASAVYGSDAIAGVVNIILRRDFDGLSVNSYYGQAERGDQDTGSYSLTWGTGNEHSHLMFSLAHYYQDEILSRDRALSASADNRARGGTDLRSSASPQAYIAVADGVVTNAENGYRDWTQEDLYNFREYTSALVPSERQSLYIAGNHTLKEGVETYAELMAITTHSDSTLAPTPVFTRFDNGDLTIAADQVYNPFGEDITDVRKRIIELGPRVQSNSTETWRMNTGFRGLVDEWQWELTAAAHYTRAKETLNNLLDPHRLSAALKGPEICSETNGCVPVDLLGAPGSIEQEQLDYILSENRVNGASRMNSVTYIADGPLWESGAGSVLAAAGIEVRREAIDFNSTDSDGLSLIGGVASGAAKGERLIGEAFAELSVPLREDTLWLDSAVRFSEYSDFGSTTNPKIAIRWRPVPSLLLRASYATGFKAPTLVDMNQTGHQSQEYLFDPCTNSNAADLPGCVGIADQDRIQYLTEFGGNPDLKPETSDNRSLGLVWTPGDVTGFHTSIDLFEIRQNDVIDTSPQYLINENAINGLFSDRVIRDERGDIIRVIATRLNIGAREVRGVDSTLRYQHHSKKLGLLRWSVNSSYLLQYLNQLAPGSPVDDLAGTFIDPASGGAGSLPDWKANTGIYWQRGRWEGGYTVHYVGDLMESFSLNDQVISRTIDSWSTHDLQLAYSEPRGFRFAVGIDNLLDEAPPFAASAFNDNFDGRTYELTGRYWYTTITFNI
ncbi:TonB-dependent receptor [Microbulbifer bruguierae]|uniref:TonB-dependent receptor n=1 Tax=Microbulbifer bruguierae TaxID=3029061 RepID=A0ABY8NCD8_9GAMM|nr:TonB-dependent receptor [Microbulbifer bruguierae]WGL16360.1 TonB-dependent receptor [Microbulbifer bruguierae]